MGRLNTLLTHVLSPEYDPKVSNCTAKTFRALPSDCPVDSEMLLEICGLYLVCAGCIFHCHTKEFIGETLE
ncbi:hypothetical protein [Vibrio phage vB_VhaP_PG11]|nr:hypothetical protein [Vibrio phage vB_VhaP_PG11]